MSDLISLAKSPDFRARAVMPARELGAYEALWVRKGTSYKTLADMFREHPEAIPSDFVSESEAQKYSRLTLGAIKDAGVKHFGIRVRTAGEYPPKLLDAAHPVALLYFQGDWDLTYSRCVAIVGTRRPSDDGVRRAAKLAQKFVEADFTVVSGLAAGVDTVAHETAIRRKGRTIAVLGTPITRTYPKENEELQRFIADRHLLISQVPIVRYSRQTWNGNRYFFPERNITMSALTEATVIIEAGNTSGTLIQARHALKQGRKLFILDSCFRNSELTWPEKMLAQGAIRVADFDEIIGNLAS